MTETCYAVSSGEYSDYEVIAVYRRREDAEARVRANNEATYFLLDGEPYHGKRSDLPQVQQERPYRTKVLDPARVERNPEREFIYDLRVEEFEYFPGQDPGGEAPR